MGNERIGTSIRLLVHYYGKRKMKYRIQHHTRKLDRHYHYPTIKHIIKESIWDRVWKPILARVIRR